MAAVHEGPVAERMSKLNSAFSLAVHSLLNACSKEEFSSHFSFLKDREQNLLYDLYAQMMAAVHENVEDEFHTICEETKVMEAMYDFEGLVRDQDRKDDHIRNRIFADVQEAAVSSKLNELEHLRQCLQQVQEQNNSLSIQLDTMHKELRSCEDRGSVDGVLLELQGINRKLLSSG